MRRDTFEGSLTEPLTLHKYIFTNSNPVGNIDPTGFSTFSIVEASSLLELLSSLAATTTTTLVRTIAAVRFQLFAAGLLAAGIAITKTSDKALLEAQWEEQQKKIKEVAARTTASDGKPLFHYTSLERQMDIVASQSLKASPTYVDSSGFAHPQGAYATEIPPVGPLTQQDFRNLYKWGDKSWDVSRFVMLSSNLDPFYPTGYFSEWVRPAPAGTFVPVHIIFSGVNLMPPE